MPCDLGHSCGGVGRLSNGGDRGVGRVIWVTGVVVKLNSKVAQQ
jgi:hypothetical protein